MMACTVYTVKRQAPGQPQVSAPAMWQHTRPAMIALGSSALTMHDSLGIDKC